MPWEDLSAKGAKGILAEWLGEEDENDAATLLVGAIVRKTKVFEVTLSLDTNIYADNDVLADTQILTAIMRKNGGSGIIKSVVLLDQDDQGTAVDLFFLRTSVNLGAENGVIDITDVEAVQIVGVVQIVAADYIDLIASQIAIKEGLNIVVDAASGVDDLYVAAAVRSGTPTYTAAGIKLKIGILLD